MRNLTCWWVASAACVYPFAASAAQACLNTARSAYILGPARDSIEIVNPALVPIGRELLIIGSGPVRFLAGRAPFIDTPLQIVRVSNGPPRSIAPPAPGARYLGARAVVDSDQTLHLLWAEADSAAELPSVSRESYGSSDWPLTLWTAAYSRRGWSAPERLGPMVGMSWYDVTPSLPSHTSFPAVAVGYAAVGGGAMKLFLRHRTGWSTHFLRTGGIPVYTSLARSRGGVVIGFITNAAGGESRQVNTVFVTDSLPGNTSWTRPVAMGRRGDHPATMLSVLPDVDGGVQLVWGQSVSGTLDAEVVRWVRLDARRRAVVTDDLRVGQYLHGLHAAADRRGGVHVVFQTNGNDERPHSFYAYRSPRSGWTAPVALTDSVPSRDPAIVRMGNDSLVITYSSFIGMQGPIPRFATSVLRARIGDCSR